MPVIVRTSWAAFTTVCAAAFWSTSMSELILARMSPVRSPRKKKGESFSTCAKTCRRKSKMIRSPE